jgi:hypothetical protein
VLCIVILVSGKYLVDTYFHAVVSSVGFQI